MGESRLGVPPRLACSYPRGGGATGTEAFQRLFQRLLAGKCCTLSGDKPCNKKGFATVCACVRARVCVCVRVCVRVSGGLGVQRQAERRGTQREHLEPVACSGTRGRSVLSRLIMRGSRAITLQPPVKASKRSSVARAWWGDGGR